MRDFRDAKAMARALRDALKGKAVETTHSESLELIAKAFGYENWNILSAKIEAAHSHARDDERTLSPAATQGSAPRKTLYCSFCCKSQYDVRKLVAGPSGYICDECVEFCTVLIREDALIWKVLSVLSTGEQSENEAYLAAFAHVRGRSTEDVASYVKTAKQFVEHNRLALDCIGRRLAMGDGEVPAEDILASPLFAYLNEKTRDELRDMQEETQRTLKRYEDALRIGTKVLGERRESGRMTPNPS